MSGLRLYLDIAMCLLWITTYSLVLIGMIKYRYPLISPLTPMVIAPLELSCTLLFAKLGILGFNYASIAYLWWVLIEIALIIVLIKNNYVSNSWRVLYIEALLVLTIIMFCLVTIKEFMLLFTYVNTTVGVVFWLVHLISCKDYPLTPLTATSFCTKFLADIFAFLVYYTSGDWVVFAFSVLLPLLDFCFIVIFVFRKIIQMRMAEKEEG